MPPAVFFDLDGTLVDTAPDIHAAAAATLAELNLLPLSFADARSYIGDGMARFIKRMLTRQWWGEPDDSLFQRACERMHAHYDRECTRGLRLYPGARAVLSWLADNHVLMACVTNKPARFTAPLLAASELHKYFTAVICGDTVATKKPDPAMLHSAAAKIGVETDHAVMVGDSIADSRAATAAGCPFVAVSYGYHRDNVIPPADVVIEHFDELPGALRQAWAR